VITEEDSHGYPLLRSVYQVQTKQDGVMIYDGPWVSQCSLKQLMELVKLNRT
jgi:hypothetical protein